MSNVRAEVLRVSRSRTGWRDNAPNAIPASGTTASSNGGQKSSTRPYISTLKSTFEGGSTTTNAQDKQSPRSDPSKASLTASNTDDAAARGSSRSATGSKVSTIANMFQSLAPSKTPGEPESPGGGSGAGTFHVRPGATTKPDSPRADHANRKTVIPESERMPPPPSPSDSHHHHQGATRTKSGERSAERRDSIPTSQDSTSALSPGSGGGGGSVHLNRTESHLARFNNARAMFERLEEQSMRSKGGGLVSVSSTAKKRSGSVSPGRASPIRAAFSPTHHHHQQHHHHHGHHHHQSATSRSPSPGHGSSAETQSVGSSPQHQSPLSPRDKSRSADCILQDSVVAAQPPFYQPQAPQQQQPQRRQQPHYSSQVNGRHHPSALDLDLHEYGAGEAIVSPGPLSPRLASYLESSPSSSDENQLTPPPSSTQHPRTNGTTGRTSGGARLVGESSDDEEMLDDEDDDDDGIRCRNGKRQVLSPISNDERMGSSPETAKSMFPFSSAAVAAASAATSTKPAPLSPKPVVGAGESSIHRSAPVATSRGNVGRFKRESPPSGSTSASSTSPRSSPRLGAVSKSATTRSSATSSSQIAASSSAAAATAVSSSHQRPRIVSATPAATAAISSDRNRAHIPQSHKEPAVATTTPASVSAVAVTPVSPRRTSLPAKTGSSYSNGTQAEGKKFDQEPTLVSTTAGLADGRPEIDVVTVAAIGARQATGPTSPHAAPGASVVGVPTTTTEQHRQRRQHAPQQPLHDDTVEPVAVATHTTAPVSTSNGGSPAADSDDDARRRTDASTPLDVSVTSGVLTARTGRSGPDASPVARRPTSQLIQSLPESPVDPDSGSKLLVLSSTNGMSDSGGDALCPLIQLDGARSTKEEVTAMPPREDSVGVARGVEPGTGEDSKLATPVVVQQPSPTSSAEATAALSAPAKVAPPIGLDSLESSSNKVEQLQPRSESADFLIATSSPSPSGDDSLPPSKVANGESGIIVTNQGTSPLSPPWSENSLPTKEANRVNGNAFQEETPIGQLISKAGDGEPEEEQEVMTPEEAAQLLSTQDLLSDEEANEAKYFVNCEEDDADRSSATSDRSPVTTTDSWPSQVRREPDALEPHGDKPPGGAGATTDKSVTEEYDEAEGEEEEDDDSSEGPYEGEGGEEEGPEEGVHYLEDGHFWVEIPGLPDHEEEDAVASYSIMTVPKKRDRVKFSTQPIRVYSTFSVADYDRRNDDVDPVSASAEYELEKRVEKMDVFPVELLKGPEGLGLSIIGMGVGADAGLEKLGIFVKTITEGGAAHRDGRINVNDQIIEVDGKSLVGVTQAYAASVLRNTSGLVRFLIGREKDGENSEVAQLISQSLQADRERDERRKVLEHGQYQHQHGEGDQRSDAYPGLTLPIPSLAVQPPAAPQNMVQEDATPEEGEDGPTCEVFDLEDDSSDSPSPDSDVTTLRIKLKEAQYKSAVGDAEIAKIKTKVAMLESRQPDSDEYERQIQLINGRLSDGDRVRDGMKKEMMAYQDMLEESQGQYILLEKKYYKAKKLIKEFQQREQDLIHREEYHLQQLQEKDQEYNSLVKLLKDRVIQLEQDLTETQKTAGLPVRLPYDNSSIKPLQLTPQQMRKPQVVSQRQTANKDAEGDMSDSELSDSDLAKYDISPDSDDTENKTSTVERKPPPSKADLFEKAVPQTELLDSTAAKSKAELASKGSLANRQPPSLKKTGSTGSSGDGTSFEHRDSDSSLGSSREDLDEFTEPSLADKTSTSTSMSSDSSPAITPLPSLEATVSPQRSVQLGYSPRSGSNSGGSAGVGESLEPPKHGHLLVTASTPPRKIVKPSQATDSRGSPVKIDGRFAEEMRLILERKNIEARKAVEDSETPYPQPYTTDDHPNLPLSSGSSATSPHSPSSATSGASDAGGGDSSSPKRSVDAARHRKAKRDSSSGCSRLNPQSETTSRGSQLCCCCCLPGSASQTADSSGAGEPIHRDDYDAEAAGDMGYVNMAHTQQPQSLFGDQDSGIGIASYPSGLPERRAYQWHSCPVPEWSTGQVGQWLLALSMEQYITAFMDGNVSGQELINMDGTKLRSFGVSNSADRSLLKKKIKDLRGVVEKERKAAEKELRAREKQIRKAEKAAEKAAGRKK